MNGPKIFALLSIFCAVAAALPSTAEALPPRFTDRVAISNLTAPSSVAFSPDGRVFVAEKSGLIKVFDGLEDTTPTQFADLRSQTYNIGDRGLLGMALDPEFPSRPYVYVSYTYDAEIGGTAPVWGTAGQSSDPCPTPPGPTADGCLASGRLSRLTASGNTMMSETVLINDWCQQYWSHSIGDVAFGADGSLYMSAGDAASYGFADYGQRGIPLNPCGDPPSGSGGVQTPPTAEGGSLRAQDFRTGGDPLGLDGSLIRVDPSTGRPIPDLPGEVDQSLLNKERIVAYGFRNPYRIAVRPGTDEIWVGDVGWTRHEEINRVRPDSIGNFGWPCIEGESLRPQAFENLDLNLCNSLYSAGSDSKPYFSYEHGVKVDPAETCETGNGSAISGIEFYEPGSSPGTFPASYEGSLFFADYARDCVWVMSAGSDGLPERSSLQVFGEVSGPVDLEVGPDGSLYYAALGSYATVGAGSIHRISHEPDNQAPIARATATPDTGTPPLQVQLDAASSSDPDVGDQLEFDWDLDVDGEFDDSDSVNPTRLYAERGVYHPEVKVTDQHGVASTDDVRVVVGSPPVPTIESPEVGEAFAGNETFEFRGSALDSEGVEIPADDLDWNAVLNHCTSGGGCHVHPIESFSGVASAEIAMPAHQRPYYLTLTLTARDSDGLATSAAIDLYPSANVAPTVQILTPSSGSRFSGGEELAFSGTANDPEDGRLPSSALSWRLVGADCSGDSCVDETLVTGVDGGDFRAPTYSGLDRLALELTATDSEGDPAKSSVKLVPDAVKVLIDSKRPGARVSIDRSAGRTPFSQKVLSGGDVRISTPARQHARGYGRGARLHWRRWSDDGGRVHFVNPLRDTTYRPKFKLIGARPR